jgi:FdhD protein
MAAEGAKPVVDKATSVHALICDDTGHGVNQQQWLIQERPVTLFVNGREMVTLLCTGHHLDELAVGFCRAEGFLAAREDLEDLHVDEVQGRVEVLTRLDTGLLERLWHKRTVTSGCGKGTVFYHTVDSLLARPVTGSVTVTPAQVWQLMQELHRMSQTYRHTHGVHNTALATPEGILLFRDDIGRHNAVDMIVGHALLHGLPLDDKLLLTTGRLTSEILIKAAKVSLPVLISRNTATTLAVQLADSLHITLIGYVRAGKLTVYSGSERVHCLSP